MSDTLLFELKAALARADGFLQSWPGLFRPSASPDSVSVRGGRARLTPLGHECVGAREEKKRQFIAIFRMARYDDLIVGDSIPDPASSALGRVAACWIVRRASEEER
jgi:hypothetical protein